MNKKLREALINSYFTMKEVDEIVFTSEKILRNVIVITDFFEQFNLLFN